MFEQLIIWQESRETWRPTVFLSLTIKFNLIDLPLGVNTYRRSGITGISALVQKFGGKTHNLVLRAIIIRASCLRTVAFSA